MEQINYFTLLQEQKNNNCKNTLYYITQLEFAYNSSKISGMPFSDTEIRIMYDDNLLVARGRAYNLTDVFEIYNHFTLFDYILNNITTPISEEFIKNIYKILKKNTREELDFPNTFGEYRKQDLDKTNFKVSSYKKIPDEICELIRNYNNIENPLLSDLIDFHYHFEKIHPFSEANGRIGRLLLYKECLRNNITPFVILDESKIDYYRGLKAYNDDKKIITAYFNQLQQIYENVAKKFSTNYTF